MFLRPGTHVRQVQVALATADLRLTYIGQRFGAHRRHLYVFSEPEEARPHTRFKDEVRACIGHEDPGDRAARTQLGLPNAGPWCPVNEAAFLLVSSPVEILIVVWAFCASGSLHE